jgi:hypothetical protein
MAPVTVRDAKFIRKLSSANHRQRQKYIREASDDEILLICNCALNLLEGNFEELKYHQKNKLRPHKHTLYKLCSAKQGLKSKRKLLIQQGGFLPTLAAAAIPAIISLLTS